MFSHGSLTADGFVFAGGNQVRGFSSVSIQDYLDARLDDSSPCSWTFSTGTPISDMTVDEEALYVGSVDKPIKRISSLTGSHECSYQAYSHVEEIVHPTRLACNSSILVGGFDSYVKAWDVSRPGRQLFDCRIGGRNTKGSMSGLVGALCIMDDKTVFAGTYNKHLGIIDLRSKSSSIQPSVTIKGGAFNQLALLDNYTLVSGHRRDIKLRFWDTRNLNSPTSELERSSNTHQCLKIDSCGGTLVYGDDRGVITCVYRDDLVRTLKVGNEPVAFVTSMRENPKLVLCGLGSRPPAASLSDSSDSSDSLEEAHSSYAVLTKFPDA